MPKKQNKKDLRLSMKGESNDMAKECNKMT